MSDPLPRPALAYHLTAGTGPAGGPVTIFLPGYASDMNGAKALALESWARGAGRAFLRFDYGGCGQSEGAFDEQTLAGWRDDVLAMIDLVAPAPVVLVGSSMGGWLMLLATLARPDRVKALVGVAAAADFTDWGFSTDEKLALLSGGRIERPSPYSDQPTVYTRAFWSSGEANRLMHGVIAIDTPVRLLHGLRDRDVPIARAIRLTELIRSADVQLNIIKDGDHRLSRDGDIALLIRAVEEVIDLP